jgi:hypothetical protein
MQTFGLTPFDEFDFQTYPCGSGFCGVMSPCHPLWKKYIIGENQIKKLHINLKKKQK